MAQTIDSLSIKITSDVEQASKSIDELSRKLLGLKLSMKGIGLGFSSGGGSIKSATSLLNLFGHSATSVTKKSFSLASAIGKIYASYWMLFRAFGKLKSAIDLSADLTETQNVVDVTFGDMRDKVQDLADVSIEQLGMSELSVKKFASRFQAMGVTMGITNEQVANASELINKLNKRLESAGYNTAANSMADMSIQLTRLVADYSSLFNFSQEDVAKDFEAVFTGMTRPLRTYGLDLRQASLQEFALANGIEKKVKEMSNAEQTLLRYEYVMANSSRAMGDFIRTADSWSNQIRILRENFKRLGAVIGGAFINFLKPMVKAVNLALNQLIGLVQRAVNALGKLLGWQIEISDVGVAEDMEDFAGAAEEAEDDLGGAADNAKKLKQQLQGFDKLNVLNSPNDSGKGGGGSGSGDSGGGSSATTGGDFSIKEISKGYMSDVKNWFNFGEKIRDAIVNGLNSIDWKSIQLNAMKWGNRFGEVLSALVTPDKNGVYTLGKAIGHTIAQALNTAVDFAYNLGQTLKGRDFFKNFANSITTSINQFFKEFDFGELGATIGLWAEGLWTTVSTILFGDGEGHGINFTLIRVKLQELIDSIKVDDDGTFGHIVGIFKDLANGILAISDSLAKFVRSETFQTFLDNVKNFIARVDESDFVEKVFEGLGIAITDIATALAGFVNSEPFQKFIDKLLDMMYLATPEDIANVLKKIAGAILLFKFTGFAGGGFLNFMNFLSFIKGLKAGSAETLGKGLSEAAKGVEETGTALATYNGAAGNATTTTGSLMGKLGGLAASGVWTAGVIGMVKGATDLHTQATRDQIGMLASSKESFDVLCEVLQKTGGWTEDLQNKYDTFSKNYETAGGDINEMTQSQQIQFIALKDDVIKSCEDMGLGYDDMKNMITEKNSELDGNFEMLSAGIDKYFNDIDNSIADKMKDASNNVDAETKNMESSFSGMKLEFPKIKMPHFSISSAEHNFLGQQVTLPKIDVDWYAKGGFPEDGLFLANHHELVGGFSNGRTAVANNEQIIEGIQNGVYNAMMSVAQNGVFGGDSVIEIDGKEVFRAVKRENQRQINRTGFGLA